MIKTFYYVYIDGKFGSEELKEPEESGKKLLEEWSRDRNRVFIIHGNGYDGREIKRIIRQKENWL